MLPGVNSESYLAGRPSRSKVGAPKEVVFCDMLYPNSDTISSSGVPNGAGRKV